jgi:hypothetical protein
VNECPLPPPSLSPNPEIVVGDRLHEGLLLGVAMNTTMDRSGCLQAEQVPGKLSGAPILKHTRMPADALVENSESGLPSEAPDMQCSLSVIAHLFRRIDHGMIGRLGKGRVMTSDEIVRWQCEFSVIAKVRTRG